MKNVVGSYEPHLVIREHFVAAGEEWLPRFSGWSLIQVRGGSGYWMQKEMGRDLETGTTLLVGPEFKKGVFRASQLGRLSLHILPIELERLIGVFSLAEQNSFASAASKEESALRIFPPESELARKMQELCNAPVCRGAPYRLRLLQFFLEVVGNDIKPEVARRDLARDAKMRLEDFLARTPASDLVNLKITDIARETGCGPRHLSRLFHEIFDISFREKQVQLRLTKACELLATTDSKIVEVALESGYQSGSLFSLMFSRQYGLSPGRWRQKYRNEQATGSRKAPKSARSARLDPETPIRISGVMGHASGSAPAPTRSGSSALVLP